MVTSLRGSYKVGELKGHDTGIVDYKAMHYSLDKGKSLKIFCQKPTCSDFYFKKTISSIYVENSLK